MAKLTLGDVLNHKHGTPEKKAVYYTGAPDKCDTCDKPFGNIMYDAAIPGSSWGNMCKSCFKMYGCSTGTGLGQEYTKQADGRWLKTAG